MKSQKFDLQLFADEPVKDPVIKSEEVIALEKQLEESQNRLKLNSDELEQLRATLVSDEYLKSLKEEEPPKVDTKTETVDLDSMSNTQLVQYLGKEIATMLPKVISQELSKTDVNRMRGQLNELNKEHPDWVKYQSEMKVLSEQNPEKSAKWLYDEAVRWKNPKLTEEKVATEKSFFGGGGFEPAKDYKSPLEAAKAAMKTVLKNAGITEMKG